MALPAGRRGCDSRQLHDANDAKVRQGLTCNWTRCGVSPAKAGAGAEVEVEAETGDAAKVKVEVEAKNLSPQFDLQNMQILDALIKNLKYFMNASNKDKSITTALQRQSNPSNCLSGNSTSWIKFNPCKFF